MVGDEKIGTPSTPSLIVEKDVYGRYLWPSCAETRAPRICVSMSLLKSPS